MRPNFIKWLLALSAIASLLDGSTSHAQHVDVLTQVVNGKLSIGGANYDNNTWNLGQKVFKRQLLSNFRANDPGFAGLATGNPLLEPGVAGIPSGIDVFFDIVPSTIDGQRANFWYWDGIDGDQNGFSIEDVDFGFAPTNITFNVFDDDFDLFTADGSNTVVSDILVQKTFSTGGLHNHVLMQIDDGDGNLSTPPPEGVYLTSLVLRADGYEDSDPFFFVHRSFGLTNDPRDVAAQFAELNYENLIRLPGDYNGDGFVNGGDLAFWQTSFGDTATPPGAGADGNANGHVDAADFTYWRDRATTTTAFTAAVSVPEPSPISLVATAAIYGLLLHRRRIADTIVKTDN